MKWKSYIWIVTEGAALVMESPYVERTVIDHYCPVVLSDIYNADLDGYASPPEYGDGENTKNIISIFQHLAHELGYCIIVVTHDPEIAAISDAVWKMADGELMYYKEA